MPELRVRDVLERLTANPTAAFRVADVAPEQLEHLRPFAVFGHDPQPGEQVACPTASSPGCMRVLDAIGGELLAVCTCEAAEAPVVVEPQAFTSFTVDTSRLAQSLARAHGLGGSTTSLTERCHYLGQMEITGQRIGLVLGLFDERDAMRELRALPGSLPSAVDHLVCLTPTFTPSPEAGQALAAIHVRVSKLRDFGVDESLEALLKPRGRTVPFIPLTPAQRQEADAAGFRCDWPIFVTGRLAKRALNIVEIDGTEVLLGPRRFPMLLRLIVGLFETENGYLTMGRLRGGGGLSDENYYPSGAVYQANGHLKKALGKYRDLIEVSAGMIRLSTHPAMVRADLELLRQHADPRVRELAERLPQNPQV